MLGRRCSCKPSYQARIKPHGRHGKPITKTFSTKALALSWAADVEAAKHRGHLSARLSPETIRDAAARLIADMEVGKVRTRAGTQYRLRVIQNYEAALERLCAEFGAARLRDLRHHHVQDFVNELLASGASPSTVKNLLMPLRVIFREALRRGEVVSNPCDHLQLPGGYQRRERVASPEEARRLLEVLRPDDRALWGAAFYGGLRRGEIAALDWDDIDFTQGVIRIRRAYDAHNGLTTRPKTETGERRVPLISEMRGLLAAHALATGRRTGLVFGVTAHRHFTPTAVRNRAVRAWRDAGLDPIGLHECRHTYASLLIAAGVNRKELATYMGHAQVATSEDLYGHLFPGHEAETARKLEDFLNAATNSARSA
jgi:integrase